MESILLKEAINNLIEKGSFDSKAQMRLLLKFYKQDPEKYSWVKDLLEVANIPKKEKIPEERCYWEGNYNISPNTPSYNYTGDGYKKRKKKKSSLKKEILKFANAVKEEGFEEESEILIQALKDIGEE